MNSQVSASDTDTFSSFFFDYIAKISILYNMMNLHVTSVSSIVHFKLIVVYIIGKTNTLKKII